MTTTKAKEKKVCFVITPIGDNNSDIRRHIDGIIDQAIVPALGEKYDIVVAHRKYEIGSINDRVIKSVFESDLVIANLTNTNPNVMFELAIRYSFGKPAIVIAEEGTKLPFDVIDENTAFYVNDPAGANELKQRIIEFEKGIDFEKKEYGPVFKVINKIPLYNEVESGTDVSNERLLQYVIDRLDSLEKNLNISGQVKLDTVVKNDRKIKIYLTILFMKNKSIDKDNILVELMDIISPHCVSKLPEVDMEEESIDIVFFIKCTDEEEIRYDIDKWVVSKKNITYTWVKTPLVF